MRDFTRSLAAYLERGSWSESEGTLIDAEFRDGKIASGIGEARTVGYFLAGKSFVSPRRTMVIWNVHALTSQAQNAILKVAEEPPAHALILFTALHPESVIPALASRFQKFYVSSAGAAFVPDAPAQATARRILAAQGRDRTEILKVALKDADAAPLVHALIYILGRDLNRNAAVLRSLLVRWTAMNQWNTNRRLQIEAALEV